MERVLHVVEVANLEVSIDLIELLGPQHQVLDLGPPDALDADVELAAGQRLGDDADQFGATQQRAIDLDDEREHVLAVEVNRPRITEGELTRRDCLQRRGSVEDERIPARTGEDTHPVPGTAMLVVDSKRHAFTGRSGAGPLLLEGLRL